MLRGWLGGPGLCLNKRLKQSKEDDEFENDSKILLKLSDTPEGGQAPGRICRAANLKSKKV